METIRRGLTRKGWWWWWKWCNITDYRRQDRIIGTANGYGLEGRGFKSRQEKDIQLVPDLFPGVKLSAATLALHNLSRLI